MRMNRAWLSLFVMGCLVCTTAAMADQTQIQVFDENGVQLVDYSGALSGQDGQLYQKLAPRPDGTWTVDVPANAKLTLRLYEEGGNNSFAVDFRMGNQVEDITTVQIPAQPGPNQTPANDTCGGALPVDIGGGAAGDTGLATFTGPYPFCGTSHTAPELWYSVMGDGTTLNASLCNTASYDTKLSVYCLDCDPAGAVCVAGNDDDFVGGCGLTSQIAFCTQAGNTYYVMVHGFSSNTGTFDLAITSDGLACSGAVECTPPEPMGACCDCDCFDPPQASCAVTTESDCAGTWQGVDTECFLLGAPVTYAATPALPIPDGGPPISTDIVVPDLESCLVGDVNVELQISHTFIADLTIDITSPAGTNVVLWPNVCGSTDNFNATADDDGTATLCLDIANGPANVVFYDPAVTGAPNTDLGIIEGEQSGGTWTLTLEDTFAADTGTLNAWAIIVTCATPVCFDADCAMGGGDDEMDDEMDDERSDGSADASTMFTIPEVDTPTQLTPRVGSSEPNGDVNDRGARGRRVR